MRKNSRFSVTFSGFFLSLLITTRNILLLSPQSTNQIQFPFQRWAEVKNKSTITTPKRDERNKKNTHYCKIKQNSNCRALRRNIESSRSQLAFTHCVILKI